MQRLTYAAIGAKLDMREQTVLMWRGRFLADRLAGLQDKPRPGIKKKITQQQVAEVVRRTLEEKPPDATHWSLRSMAAASGISRSSVNTIWRAFNLQPHRSQTFKLSTDPRFVEKVRDIVGLYTLDASYLGHPLCSLFPAGASAYSTRFSGRIRLASAQPG